MRTHSLIFFSTRRHVYELIFVMFYVIEAVRMPHKHVSDAEIGENISKWLAQAPVRIERALYVFTGYSFYIQGVPK